MKRLIYILLFMIGTLSVQAQEKSERQLEGSSIKNFGGFIIDMGTMLNAESLTLDMYLPPLSLVGAIPISSTEWVNPDAFRFNPNIIYIGGTDLSFGRGMCFNSNMMNWKGASYKLNNGMRINLYGEYDADGYKVFNPSAMPWQRKNFNAAFEMKSANGNFGIRVEVHGGRNNP